MKTQDTSVASLAGTAWELVAIQSMDDAQGTTRIAKPETFTVCFAVDGRASFRIDCNRGTTTWKITPSQESSSGSLEFGLLATTRAMCPHGSQDQRVLRDLPHVRSYMLKDGKLYLSLMADGGIYEWRPAKP
ncbi:MAG TPA: META domain-containing protein [Nitrosomonas sp.]|nr:META domain-containing protein [Nitrosomonas sp.]